VPQTGRIFVDEERKSSSQDLNSQGQKKGDSAGQGTSSGQRMPPVRVPLSGTIFVDEERKSNPQDLNEDVRKQVWFYEEPHEWLTGVCVFVAAVIVIIVLAIITR
jgi:hypothetical protein